MISCEELGHAGPRTRHPFTYTAVEPEPLQQGCLDYICTEMEEIQSVEDYIDIKKIRNNP